MALCWDDDEHGQDRRTYTRYIVVSHDGTRRIYDGDDEATARDLADYETARPGVVHRVEAWTTRR